MSDTPSEGKSAGTSFHILIAAIVVCLLAGIGVGVYAIHERSHPPAAGADVTDAVVPLTVVGTDPANGDTGVDPGTAVTVDFSTALTPSSPLPTLNPPVPGNWSPLSPDAVQFDADGPFAPGSAETLIVPGGTTGVRGTHGQRLATTTTVHFTVAPGSTLRLQQLLAELGYLPVSFTPASEPTSPAQAADPQQGTFSWRWSSLPSTLTSLWVPGTYGVVTRGAVMSFETQHGLKTDGLAGLNVWTDLLQAAQEGATDPAPYAYVLVSKTKPETATVYQNGANVYSTLANTGVAAAPTATGTFPVFARYRVTTMSGTNPDGSHYVDPGIPWVSYFNGGDALHGFVRGGYGYPQSDGCVEMPPANAAVVWPMTPIGTLVTVR